MSNFLINSRAQSSINLPPFSTRALEFHRSLPVYNASPLHSVKNIAEFYGYNNIYVKDESNRFTLPAFKVLGASFATFKVLEQKFNIKYSTIDEFKSELAKCGGLELVTATDGNHGRAVAFIARLLGLKARIYVPKHTKESRIRAIESEGAQVIIINGNYDKAVEIASKQDAIIIQDTGYVGYEDIPKYIVEGYSTMFWEIEEQLSTNDLPNPDVIIAPIGVGSFISAVIQFYKSTSPYHPIILGVEPKKAPCALESIRQDLIITLKGRYESVMAGLSCGRISTISFPILREGVDAFLLVSDEQALKAMKVLAKQNIVSGESGAASFAALVLLFSEEGSQIREYYHIDDSTNFLVFSTEGATDPFMYSKVMNTNNLKELI
ncbi:MAG: diaminopropionate ammonia-lyase [Candidatus Lokiarchaeota archaeon]|nr:diaminopropionate ammonia-lyase [Candidatus Lokiarchaeota archaeon]